MAQQQHSAAVHRIPPGQQTHNSIHTENKQQTTSEQKNYQNCQINCNATNNKH